MSWFSRLPDPGVNAGAWWTRLFVWLKSFLAQLEQLLPTSVKVLPITPVFPIYHAEVSYYIQHGFCFIQVELRLNNIETNYPVKLCDVPEMFFNGLSPCEWYLLGGVTSVRGGDGNFTHPEVVCYIASDNPTELYVDLSPLNDLGDGLITYFLTGYYRMA